MSATSGLAAGVEIASRYRVDEALRVPGAGEVFLGTDQQSGQRVVLYALSEEEAVLRRPLVGVEHAHLAAVLDVAAGPEGPVLVAEHVVGPSLPKVLGHVERETPVEAVRSALRVADAICVVHQANGVHGGIRPGALIVAPDEHPPPRLAFLPPADEKSPYCRPEQGEGPATVADDAWAVAALLYEMLLGAPPPMGGVTSEEELTSSGLEDATLRKALAHGLAANPSLRHHDMTPLKRELAGWFVDNAGDDPSGLHRGSNPPPLPPGSQRIPVSSKRRSVAPPPPKRSLLVPAAFGGLAFVVTVGLVWGYFAFGRPAVVVEVPTSAGSQTAAPAPSEASIDLNAVAVMGAEDAGLGDQMATCVAGWLPKGAFGTRPDFGWVCKQPDPRDGAVQLRTALVANKAAGTTEAMKVFSRLGWYDLAVYAVIHEGCCSDEPLKVPPPKEGCGGLGEPLRQIGSDVVANRDPKAALDAFDASARCEMKSGTQTYRRPGPPTSDNRAAFEEYVKAIQSP